MTEREIIEYLQTTKDLLPPLRRDSVNAPLEPPEKADVFLAAFAKDERFLFLVEVKSRSTPQIVHQAISQIKTSVKDRKDSEVFPMIAVPYLSDDRLRDLEGEEVSGIDLCGNGIVTIPGRLLIYRTGNENRYPESRPVSNPYQGKSGLVGRVFLSVAHPVLLNDGKTTALGEVREAIVKGGIDISMSQVSKTISALVEERILGSQGRAIHLLDPDLLRKRLAAAWPRTGGDRIYLRLPDGLSSLSRLNADQELHWALAGESSVTRYTAFAQGGPMQVAVSDHKKAMNMLQGVMEPVPNFSDVALLQSDEPGFYFENQMDAAGLRWASPLQTWIELRNGDARQRDAARDVGHLIIPSSSL